MVESVRIEWPSDHLSSENVRVLGAADDYRYRV